MLALSIRIGDLVSVWQSVLDRVVEKRVISISPREFDIPATEMLVWDELLTRFVMLFHLVLDAVKSETDTGRYAKEQRHLLPQLFSFLRVLHGLLPLPLDILEIFRAPEMAGSRVTNRDHCREILRRPQKSSLLR